MEFRDQLGNQNRVDFEGKLERNLTWCVTFSWAETYSFPQGVLCGFWIMISIINNVEISIKKRGLKGVKKGSRLRGNLLNL